jgi:hypothetical protein
LMIGGRVQHFTGYARLNYPNLFYFMLTWVSCAFEHERDARRFRNAFLQRRRGSEPRNERLNTSVDEIVALHDCS